MTIELLNLIYGKIQDPFENEKLVEETFNIIASQKKGNPTKKLSLPQVQNLLNLNRSLDKIYHLNSQTSLDGVHYDKVANLTNFEVFMNYKNAKITEIFSLQKKEIFLSVLLPLFRAENIAWLSLESLCRQEDIDFGWELIIIEEIFDSPFGLDKLKEYWDRLQKVGCKKIKYISIQKWMPLSAKWYFLVKECDKNSEIVAFSSADIYSSKKRLSKQFKVLKETDYNWYKISGNIVYDISSSKHVRIKLPQERNDNCSPATKKNLLQKLPLICLKKHVDSWRFKILKKHGINFFYDDTQDLQIDTVNVNGLNNLTQRKDRILSVVPPLSECCNFLENHLPNDIVSKLELSKNLIKNHNELKKNSKISL